MFHIFRECNNFSRNFLYCIHNEIWLGVVNRLKQSFLHSSNALLYFVLSRRQTLFCAASQSALPSLCARRRCKNGWLANRNQRRKLRMHPWSSAGGIRRNEVEQSHKCSRLGSRLHPDAVLGHDPTRFWHSSKRNNAFVSHPIGTRDR